MITKWGRKIVHRLSVDIFSAPFLGQKTALKKRSEKQPNIEPPIPRRSQRLPDPEAVWAEELRLKEVASRKPLHQRRCLALLQPRIRDWFHQEPATSMFSGLQGDRNKKHWSINAGRCHDLKIPPPYRNPAILFSQGTR